MVEQGKHFWTWPWVLYRWCNTTPQGHAPAVKVEYLHALFAPETFAPVSCNSQRTGNSRAVLILSFFAFLFSLDCHSLHGADTCIQISAPLSSHPFGNVGPRVQWCSTPAGLGLCRAEPKTLVKLIIRCYCHFSFFKGVRSETTSADACLSTTNFMNHFQACQMSAMWTGAVTLGTALAEELSPTQVLASIQDYGWFLGGDDIQDVRVNAIMVCCRLELHKFHKGEK